MRGGYDNTELARTNAGSPPPPMICFTGVKQKSMTGQKCFLLQAYKPYTFHGSTLQAPQDSMLSYYLVLVSCFHTFM